MTLGVETPIPSRAPSRAAVRIATAIWIAVAAPFGYLAALYWTGPPAMFSDWRGWVFAAVAVACVLLATVVPGRYRVAVVGTRLKGWGNGI